MKRKVLQIVSVMLFIATLTLNSSYAYFDRGNVQVTVGQDSVTIKKGSTANITASTVPSESKQLPGCGMPECPQVCGEKDCLNENGDCKCSGLEYSTYKSDISTQSSNAAVATANYSNGVVQIKGISEGSATITVTGSLRQYKNTSKTIAVNVYEDKSQPEQTTPSVKPNDKKDIEVVSITDDEPEKVDTIETKDKEEKLEEQENKDKEEEKEAEAIDSHQGLVKRVKLDGSLVKKEEFNKLLSQNDIVIFERQNNTENVLYSWTFKGRDITTTKDIDMGISTTDKINDKFSKFLKDKESLVLSFAHKGKLPDKATMSLRVSDYFSDNDTLNLYYYSEENDKPELIEKDIKIQNGYVNFELDHCSQYFLTKGEISESEESKINLPLMGVFTVIALILLVVGIKKYKK